jgi:NDP-sugar pyrophosphorylase family protein
MKVMILAAGLGTRLRPLTLERAKPAIPVLGKPLVIRLIENLMEQGATEFRLNLHHLPSSIDTVFASPPWMGVPASFSYEETILGTAGGLKDNESFFNEETFLMANGDILFDFPLDRALSFHKEQEALATLVLYRQTPPYRHFPIRITEDGRLQNFKNVRGPAGKVREGTYVFTGIHILEPEIFELIPPGCFCEINDEVYPEALNQGKRVLGFPVEGYWNDLGDPARYLQASTDLLRHWETTPPAYVSADVRVGDSVEIGANVSIEAGCRLDSNTGVQNAILWENVRVTNHASVRNCIVGSDMIIDSDCSQRIITRHGEAPIDVA